MILSINILKESGHFWQKHFCIILVFFLSMCYTSHLFLLTKPDPLLLTWIYVLELDVMRPCDTLDFLFCSYSLRQATEWAGWVLCKCVTMARWRERMFYGLCLTDLVEVLREEPTHDLWVRRLWVPLIASLFVWYF
jgi:hypothetical protein